MPSARTIDDVVALCVSPQVAEALEILLHTLRTQARLYHDVELSLQRLQRGRTGPLTDFLAAVVGPVDQARRVL